MDFRFIQYYGDTFYGYDNAQNILYVRQMLEIDREFVFTIVSRARRPLSRSYAEDRETTNGAKIAGGRERII